jgi:hypothetical protein
MRAKLSACACTHQQLPSCHMTFKNHKIFQKQNVTPKKSVKSSVLPIFYRFLGYARMVISKMCLLVMAGSWNQATQKTFWRVSLSQRAFVNPSTKHCPRRTWPKQAQKKKCVTRASNTIAHSSEWLTPIRIGLFGKTLLFTDFLGVVSGSHILSARAEQRWKVCGTLTVCFTLKTSQELPRLGVYPSYSCANYIVNKPTSHAALLQMWLT